MISGPFLNSSYECMSNTVEHLLSFNIQSCSWSKEERIIHSYHGLLLDQKKKNGQAKDFGCESSTQRIISSNINEIIAKYLPILCSKCRPPPRLWYFVLNIPVVLINIQNEWIPLVLTT